MTKRWRRLKQVVSRWATNLGVIVSDTASILFKRHQQRQVGIVDADDPLPMVLLSKFEDDLDEVPDTFDSIDKDTVSLGSTISGSTEDFSSVLLIPYDCRAIMYDYVNFGDILHLRLTCKQIFYELNYCRGIRLKLDDTITGFDWFRNTGVGSLIIRHFRTDATTTDEYDNHSLLKRPQLLKELVVNGSISPENFNWLITTCPNIKKFAVEISPYTVRYGFQSFFMDTLMPSNLSTLRLSAFMYDHRDAENTSDNIFPILNNVNCPHLNQFIFQLVIIDSQSLENFHINALKLIESHAISLKVLQVQIKQVFVASHNDSDQRELQMILNKWVNTLQLKELRFTLDRHINKWIPILNAQFCLESLELNLLNLSWNTIFLVVKQCSRTLKNIQIYSLNARNNIHSVHLHPTRQPRSIDLGILRYCESLEKLTIHHQEHTPIFHPKICRTAYLPSRLIEIDISQILVKQHQLLFILIRLPKLKKLDLAFWTVTDSDFASLLSLLPLLIKFNMTSIKTFCIVECRRKFENHRQELTRLTNFLCGLATVKSTDLIRETRVTIEVNCGSFNDD